MSRIPIPFVNPTDDQDKINLFSEFDPTLGKWTFRGRYGLDLFSSLGAEPVRGWIAVDPHGYIVAGDGFYKLYNDGTKELIGTIGTSAGRVGIARNELQIAIVDGTTTIYVYVIATGVLTPYTPAGFSGANDIAFFDHFFVVDNLTGGTAQVSALEDGSTWNAADKATPEIDPDGLTRCKVIHSTLWMLNESTSEPWYNANLPTGFPCLRQTSGVMDMGIAARWSAVEADNTIYWLAKNKAGLFGIVRLAGSTPQKISTPEMDKEIAAYSTVLDCISWAFTDRGHTFINFIFPTANKSHCYDPSTGHWHRTESFGLGAFRCGLHMTLNGQHLLADRFNGNIYKVNWDTYTDNGTTIEAVRTCQHMAKNGDPLELSELMIDMAVGLGKSPKTYDADGNEEPPQAMISVSKNYGKTWGNEYFRSMGKTGEYKKEVKVTRLGTANAWTLKVRITDACLRIIRGASGIVGVE